MRRFSPAWLGLLVGVFLVIGLRVQAQTTEPLPDLRPAQQDMSGRPAGAAPAGTAPQDRDVVREPEAADINTEDTVPPSSGGGSVSTIGDFADDPFAVPPGGRWIESKEARFTALDKITGRTAPLAVDLNKEARFGTLGFVPRACFNRPLEETPESTVFLEITEYDLETGKPTKIFSGWMFSSSPALNAVEHPIYDVWLTGCAKPVASAEPAIRPSLPSRPKSSE